MSYRAHEILLAPARHRAELWRTALGVVGIVLSFIAAIFLLVIVLTLLFGGASVTQLANGATPVGLVFTLASYALIGVAVALCLRLLHRREWASLLGPTAAFRRDFLRVALPILVLGALMLPLSTASAQVGRHLGFAEWLGWLPLALPALFVQSGAEELAFRGYLQSQLGARFRAPLIWMVLPSLAFGLLHFEPARFGVNAWMIAAWAVLFGLAAADLTARTGNLGAAMGFHFANNVGAVLLMGLYGDLDALALWNTVVNLRDPAELIPYLLVDFVWMLICWLLARLMLRV